VAVRVRPLSSKEIAAGQNVCCHVTSESTISIVKCGDENGYLKSQQTSINEYAFDFVFNELSSQRDVFEKTTLSFLPTIINGQNVTVFAYGSTGAGKTHTMLGKYRFLS
jgi:kinesin family protein 18/19